jgi:hypothetical protein
MFNIYYKKNNNKALFKEFKNVGIENIQNYIPIYKHFFNLQENNYQNINLNHYYTISNVEKDDSKNVYKCRLQSDKNEVNTKTFFKFSPLIDPVKYMVGKYENIEGVKSELPQLSNNKCIKKVLDPNNSAYVDAFFSYLTSNLLHHHKFIHGLDFYGSFLGVQKNFKINVFDDLEYLNESEFFHENNNKLFKMDDLDNTLFFDADTRNFKRKLKIEKNISNKSVYSLKNEDFDDLFKPTIITEGITKELIFQFDISNNSLSKSKNSSECSSRSSHTSIENSDSEYDEIIDDEDSEDTEETCSEVSRSIDSDIECCANIEDFPVQVICLEKMEATLDSLLEEDMNVNEWKSCLFQIIMILITYQKMFNFTHNDLHTNNIMYINTEKEFIYYKYESKYYKVPTYGKLYKIIDFGRAIYTYKGKFICSDSFHPKGDAATQYNIEPYINKKKPRLNPNPAFDLCRLACSLYDYFLHDIDIENINTCGDPIAIIINEWCTDDKGRNILYKKCGEERYPEFKLYKMIARTVHKHTPQNQLDNIIFSKFKINRKKANKKKILDIDKLPIYV